MLQAQATCFPSYDHLGILPTRYPFPPSVGEKYTCISAHPRAESGHGLIRPLLPNGYGYAPKVVQKKEFSPRTALRAPGSFAGAQRRFRLIRRFGEGLRPADRILPPCRGNSQASWNRSQRRCWTVYDEWTASSDVVFADEPTGLEAALHQRSSASSPPTWPTGSLHRKLPGSFVDTR